ncbi:Uncharacterised protein [uncultured archaeon]|nr:Uncharacterised protein [uncultured archaeon]
MAETCSSVDGFLIILAYTSIAILLICLVARYQNLPQPPPKMQQSSETSKSTERPKRDLLIEKGITRKPFEHIDLTPKDPNENVYDVKLPTFDSAFVEPSAPPEVGSFLGHTNPSDSTVIMAGKRRCQVPVKKGMMACVDNECATGSYAQVTNNNYSQNPAECLAKDYCFSATSCLYKDCDIAESRRAKEESELNLFKN